MLLVTGNAVETPWLSQVDGLIQTWYLGSMAGYAIADIVSGDVNPSGKLPFSFPKKLQDNGAHAYGELSYPGDGTNQYYKEDILVGYRWFDTKKIAPAYAFGYGLSYTTFNITDIKTDKKIYLPNDKIKVTCQVTNTGYLDGAEVIQVYVGKRKSKVKRALKELKGFQKINLKAGEQNTAEIIINAADLAFYDESISDWNLEKGDYKVFIGNASNNIYKTINISIK